MSRKEVKAAILKYVVGFVMSLTLTLAAFGLVLQHIDNHHEGSHSMLALMLIALAVVQLVVQLVFFLHLGRETKPRWNFIVFLFMIMVLVIVVFGSLWIMQNLDYNMMGPTETKEYMRDHPGSF